MALTIWEEREGQKERNIDYCYLIYIRNEEMKLKKENRNKGKYKQTVLKTGKVSGSKHVFLERSDTYILPH